MPHAASLKRRAALEAKAFHSRQSLDSSKFLHAGRVVRATKISTVDM
jgi:hypothetical protein